MRYFKMITSLILLLCTPSLFSYPHVEQCKARLPKKFRKQERFDHLSFDEIITFLHWVESEPGNLDNDDIRRINRFLRWLAERGSIPGTPESAILAQDIRDLCGADDDVHFCDENADEYYILPLVLLDEDPSELIDEVSLKKKWEKTKKFCKKHKTAIIIGAVIIAIAATTIIVIASTAAATSAAAGAVGAAAGLTGDKSQPASDPRTDKDFEAYQDLAQNIPVLNELVNHQAAEFKERIYEDPYTNECLATNTQPIETFAEKARELGSHIAHQTLDEISEYVSWVPELCEEIQGVSQQLAPDGIANNLSSPRENFSIAKSKGHEAIDRLFSTDQAEQYTPEAKSQRLGEELVLGWAPPPGAVFKKIADISKYRAAGRVPDRAGFTKAGRSLMKHGYRNESVFPKPIGNPSQVNAQGQQILDSILNHPDRLIYERPHPDFGKVMDIVIPDKMGVRFTIKGEMVGFLEP